MNKPSPRKLLLLATSGALLFYAMSGISSVLNYALYPVLSRILSIENYGEIQFLLSTFNQLSFGFVVLNILAIVLTASSLSSKDKSTSITSLNIVAGAVALGISLIGTIILMLFANDLKISNSSSILLLSLSFILNVPFTTLLGRLQGDERFLASGIVSLVATIGKFIFSVIFALLGFGVTGVLAGIVCGMVAALLVGILYTEKTEKTQRIAFSKHMKRLKSIKRQAFASSVAIFVVTFLSGIDLLASRVVLGHTEAGYYAVVATLAKITIAACSPLIWLALPAAAKRTVASVWRYIGLGAVVCMIFILLLAIDPATLTRLLMSVDPGVYSSVLVTLTVSMSTYALSFITLSSLVAAGVLRYVYLAVIISTCMFTLVFGYLLLVHHTAPINAVIVAQLLAGTSLLVASLISLTRLKHDSVYN